MGLIVGYQNHRRCSHGQRSSFFCSGRRRTYTNWIVPALIPEYIHVHGAVHICIITPVIVQRQSCRRLSAIKKKNNNNNNTNQRNESRHWDIDMWYSFCFIVFFFLVWLRDDQLFQEYQHFGSCIFFLLQIRNFHIFFTTQSRQQHVTSICIMRSCVI